MVEVCPLSDFFEADRVVSFDGCMIARGSGDVIKPVVEFFRYFLPELYETKKEHPAFARCS